MDTTIKQTQISMNDFNASDWLAELREAQLEVLQSVLNNDGATGDDDNVVAFQWRGWG